MYKEIVKKAELFQKEFGQESQSGVWIPRLRSLVKIAQDMQKSEEIVVTAIIEAVKHWNDGPRSELVLSSQEILYFSYIMMRRYTQYWNHFVQDWLYVEQSEQQYCIQHKIKMYVVGTPVQNNIAKRFKTLDLDEAKAFNPVKEDKDLNHQWYIVDLTDQNKHLFKYEPFYKKWVKV